jgi:hypothetical protein
MEEFGSRIHYSHMLLQEGFREAVLNAGDGQTRHTWRFGPEASMCNNSLKVTIVADLIGIAWLTAGRGPEGVAVTVVVVGHRSQTGTRAVVSQTESDAWLRALLGRQWSALAYRLVESHKTGDGPPEATYRLFLNRQQHAIVKPAEVIGTGYRLMDDPLAP